MRKSGVKTSIAFSLLLITAINILAHTNYSLFIGIAIISIILSLFVFEYGGKYSIYTYIFYVAYVIYASIGENMGRRGENLNIKMYTLISFAGLLILLVCIFWLWVKAGKRRRNNIDS